MKDYTVEDVIAAARTVIETTEHQSLIAYAADVELADWSKDIEVRDSIANWEDTKAVYFMFACFVLLALGEEL